MATTGKSLAELIGENVRRLRGTRTQDELAGELRRYGLPWGRSVLSSVEQGARRLDLGEVALLVLGLGVELDDLLAGSDPVRLNETASVNRAAALREILGGRASSVVLGDFSVPATDPAALKASLQAALRRASAAFDEMPALVKSAPAWALEPASEASNGEAERHVAQRLGLDPFAVSLGAFALWGHSLTEERDRRLSDEGSTSRRTLQARRGHVGRALIAELREGLERSEGD